MSGLTFRDTLHVLSKRGDNYVNFQVSRQDMGSVADKQFNAWIAATGEYIIMERNLADSNDIITKYFHSKNSENSGVFQTDWDARSTLTFLEYDGLFS